MVYNLRDRIDDISSLRPQEVTPVTPRHTPVQVPKPLARPFDNTPSSMGLFASMLNGVANIGRTVAGVIQQNNAAVAEREYDKISTKFDQEIALLQNEDLSTFPEKYDEILNRYREYIDDLGRGKDITKRIKAMLIDNSEDRAYQLFTNTITANKQQLVTSYNTKMTEAIENRDRSKVNKLIYDAAVGTNAIFNRNEADAQIIKATKSIDVGIVKDYLYGLPFDEAMKILDTPDYKFKVTEDKTTYPSPGDTRGLEPKTVEGRFIELNQAQNSDIKTMIVNNYIKESKAINAQIIQSTSDAFETISKGEISHDDFLNNKDGNFSALDYRARMNILEDIEAENRSDMLDSRQDFVFYRSEIERNEAQEIEQLINEGEITDVPGLRAYTDDNERVNAKDVTKWINRLSPKGESIVDKAKLLSFNKAESVRQSFLNNLDIAEAQNMLNEMRGTDDNGLPLVYSADYKAAMEFIEGWDPIAGKQIIETIDNSPKLKDDDLGKLIIRKRVVDQIMADENMTAEQKMLLVDSTINLYTEEEIMELTKEVLERGIDVGKSNFLFAYTNKMEESVEHLNAGALSGMAGLYPEVWERYAKHHQDQVEVITGEKYEGFVRLHDGYLPVYNINGRDMVVDIKNGKGVMVTLDQAKKDYLNLTLGYPLGAVEMVGDVATGRIMTQSGWFRRQDLKHKVVKDATVYYVADENDNPTENGMVYIGTLNWQDVPVYVPTYLPDINDETQIAAKVKDIRESPEPVLSPAQEDAQEVLQFMEDAKKAYPQYFPQDTTNTTPLYRRYGN